MFIDDLTHDQVIVLRAAAAYRTEQPMFAETLLREARDPLRTAVELVGLFMVDHAERAGLTS